jgi:hypothetical protein
VEQSPANVTRSATFVAFRYVSELCILRLSSRLCIPTAGYFNTLEVLSVPNINTGLEKLVIERILGPDRIHSIEKVLHEKARARDFFPNDLNARELCNRAVTSRNVDTLSASNDQLHDNRTAAD